MAVRRLLLAVRRRLLGAALRPLRAALAGRGISAWLSLARLVRVLWVLSHALDGKQRAVAVEGVDWSAGPKSAHSGS